MKTKHLVTELHPSLQKMFGDFIQEVENRTDFVYYGIYNGLEKHGMIHYHVMFQHRHYFEVNFDFSYGQAGSCGNKYYVNDDGNIHMGACDGSASFVYGEYPIVNKDCLENILRNVSKFAESFN